jgi:hypothetical protein
LANARALRGSVAERPDEWQGTYFFSNGDRYVGPWLRGECDGRSTYTDAAGNTQAMEFRGGQRVS